MFRSSSLTRALVLGALLYVACATPALAQLNTQHIKGTVGLKAGSQPPPHAYFILPLLYLYTYARTNTKGGELTILSTFLVKPLRLPTP